MIDDRPPGHALQTQVINELDYFSRLGIDNQQVLVLGIFHIAIGSKGANILPVAPLVVKYLADLL